MNTNKNAAHIIKADGFGRMMRWEVVSARQVTIGEQTFSNLRIRPVALVDSEGNDLPTVHLSKGRTVTAAVTGPVETYNIY